MDDDRGENEGLIIPPGQEALLQRMLGTDLPQGFTLVRAQTHAHWIEAEYAHAGRAVVVRLEHPAQSQRQGVDTRTFRIVAPAADTLDGLVRALVRNTEALEHGFHWDRPVTPKRLQHPGPPPPEQQTLDIEWLAFRAGIKPAIRISCEASEADGLAKRYLEGDAHVRRGSFVIDGRKLAVIYVARSEDEAERLRRIECDKSLLSWVVDRFEHHNNRLGRLLGYPECCVAAYGRRSRGKGRENDWYRSARAAWVQKPMPRLNALLMVEGRSLLSFDACRYDCPAALALAERLAEAAHEANAGWLAYAEHQLALPIAVDRRGARAHVELDRPIWKGGARIVEAWAPVSLAGSSLQLDVELAYRLRNRFVSRQGLVEDLSGRWPPIVMDFSADR